MVCARGICHAHTSCRICIITFCAVFPIQTSYECSDDHGAACFNSYSWSEQPLNCTELADGKSVVCFTFVLTAFSTAGGILSIMAVIMSISLSVATAISSSTHCNVFGRLIFIIISHIDQYSPFGSCYHNNYLNQGKTP